MAKSVDPDQTAPVGAVCYGSTLFASILNSSVMLGNYLQQTTSADDIFRCIFLLCHLRAKTYILSILNCGFRQTLLYTRILYLSHLQVANAHTNIYYFAIVVAACSRI